MNSQNNLAIEKQTECFLKSLSGELKGKVFRLTSKEIYIGRDPSNHISIPGDIRLSRKHARFILHEGKIFIQNLTEKNFIKVNNEKVNQAELKNNYIVLIGSQTFKFITSEKSFEVVPNQREDLSKGRLKRGSVQKSSNKKNFYFLIIAFTLGGLYFYAKSGGASRQSKMKEISTTDKIYEKINQSTKELEEIENELKTSERQSKSYLSSHKFYLRGFRDFQKGLYASAISSFETSLSLFPQHKLSRRYLNISSNRSEELTAYYLTEGRVNLNNGRYNYCISSFKNAILQMHDKSDLRYKEAKLLLKKCQMLQRSKY